MKIWKISQSLRGEWWIISGQAVFADGDIGDMNHEMYVIQSVQRQYVDDEFDRMDYIDWEGFEQTFQNPDQALKELGMSDEEIEIARGQHPDAREYGIKNFGWQRVKGNSVETNTLTSEDMGNIASGLGDVLESEGIDGDYNFEIEVRSTNTLYSEVPYSVIEQRRPELLKQYGLKYTWAFSRTKIWKIAMLTEKEEDEAAEKYLEMHNEQMTNMLHNYYDKKRKKGSMMSWDVIPFARLKKIWTDYAKMGVIRDEKGMQSIVDQMIRILARLNASNDLAGHGNIDDETIKDMTGYDMPDGDNAEFYFDYLETKHGTPISDYGLPKLYEIGRKLMFTNDPVEQLLLVDQMLNIVHPRGDLSALFVEGGRASLDQLAGFTK